MKQKPNLAVVNDPREISVIETEIPNLRFVKNTELTNDAWDLFRRLEDLGSQLDARNLLSKEEYDAIDAVLTILQKYWITGVWEAEVSPIKEAQ